jgi:RND family efflux transporter MFP subunit
MSSCLSAFGLALALACAACGETGNAAQRGAGGGMPPAPVKLVTLAPTPVSDTTEYLGVLKSRRSITIQPQVDGQLIKIFVKSGDIVEAGAPLMQIDPSRQEAQVVSSQATRASRLASLAFAKQQLERVQRLFDSGATSRQDLDQAKSNVEAAQADVDALGAQIRQNQVQLEYYRITAPAKGAVGDIPVRVGDHVSPQTILTTLTDNTGLEAYVSIPIERAPQLRMGMDVQLLDAAGALIGHGTIHFIAPNVNPDTQSILVKSDVADPKIELRAEQSVRARVVWSSHEGVVVPALSVIKLNGQTFVFVAADEGGKLLARQRPVDLGELTGATYNVRAGLKPGERIVAEGAQKLQDGAPILDAAAAPPPQKS